jgi:DNA-binding transcriptional LysR family regulator
MKFNSEIEINSNEAIIEAVQAGLGIGFVSKQTRRSFGRKLRFVAWSLDVKIRDVNINYINPCLLSILISYLILILIM